MSQGIYVRVSKGRGQDAASQEPDLRRWAESQGGEAVWYRDRMTGKTMERPGFDRMMADVRSGKVCTIAV